MSKAQWLVLGMLAVTLAIELAVQPSSRTFFVHLFNTLNPVANATAGG